MFMGITLICGCNRLWIRSSYEFFVQRLFVEFSFELNFRSKDHLIAEFLVQRHLLAEFLAQRHLLSEFSVLRHLRALINEE